MDERRLYLMLCIVGTVLPLSQFLPWVFEHGLDFDRFFRELFSTRIGGFFGMDVIVSAITAVVFFRFEGPRTGVHRLWLPLVALFSVGVSLGLPLFLYLRCKSQGHVHATPHGTKIA